MIGIKNIYYLITIIKMMILLLKVKFIKINKNLNYRCNS